MKHNNEFCVIDLETSGLNPADNAIVEVSIVVLNYDLENIEKYCKIVKPYNVLLKYEVESLKISKLTMKDINSGSDSQVVINEMCELFKRSKDRSGKKPVLVGHNIQSFDLPFLCRFFDFHKRNLWLFVENYCIDTMWISRFAYKELDSYKLGAVCNRNGISLSNAHSALGDVIANAELLKVFLKSLRGKEVEEKRFRTEFQF